jgi:hypothetical protein
MKKIILISTLLLSITLQAFIIEHQGFTIELNSEELNNFTIISVETWRDKDGEKKQDIWQGVRLLEILQNFKIENFDYMQFNSNDNYQVRLTKDEIDTNDPILALKRNGRALSEETIRLVVPGKRDMYWIQGIASISTGKTAEMIIPTTIFVAEKIIENLKLINDPEPFKKTKGIFFRDLIAGKYPTLQCEFWLLGRDGVSHKLDYSTYLQSAVLIYDEGKFHLQSPAMPAGMWIKNIAYIQALDRGIIFLNELKNFQQLINLAEWNNSNLNFKDENGSSLDMSKDFDNSYWQKVMQIKWHD